jgi:hypothetical protein
MGFFATFELSPLKKGPSMDSDVVKTIMEAFVTRCDIVLGFTMAWQLDFCFSYSIRVEYLAAEHIGKGIDEKTRLLLFDALTECTHAVTDKYYRVLAR